MYVYAKRFLFVTQFQKEISCIVQFANNLLRQKFTIYIYDTNLIDLLYYSDLNAIIHLTTNI